jgi:DNA-binding CsgD family transcriptional regulator
MIVGACIRWMRSVEYSSVLNVLPRSVHQRGQPIMRSRHDLREQIISSQSVDSAVGVLAKALSDIGIDRFITGYIRGSAQGPTGEWRMYKHRAFNFPRGWDTAWHHFNAHCPYYHACFDGRVGFDWATVRARTNLTVKERRAWHYLADFGLIRGFTVPTHAPGHFGFVTVIGEPTDRSWARRAETNIAPLLFLSHIYHEAFRDRFQEFFEVSKHPHLSYRERECLGWVAAGKTTDELAGILGLSRETVKIYVKRAMRKLGANTRSQAVARAYREGLLEME